MIADLAPDVAMGTTVAHARRSFYYYCYYRAPSFYRQDRKYLQSICDHLQALVENRLINADTGEPLQGLILNMPPRHGKTRTVISFVQWYLGRYPRRSVMAASYNELLSSRVARAVRDGIGEKKVTNGRLVFSDYFPGVEVKDGDSSMQVWSLKGSHFSFLATSPGGTMTGAGCNLLLVDDIVKNADEAYNERVLDGHQDWYVNTVLSRLEHGAKQVIIQTRWATRDLTGRLLEAEADRWGLLSVPAYNEETGEMLAPDILSIDEYRRREERTDPVVFQGNYQQRPFDSIDRLYPSIRYYGVSDASAPICAVVDTADKGGDYLAAIVYAAGEDTAYVLDVLYTQEGMAVTESRLAEMLRRNNVRTAWIESNNGGEGFARNVRALMARSGFHSCDVQTFHQTQNKEARILSHCTSVCNVVAFPSGADEQPGFRAYLHDIKRAGRGGKWVHDDAMDAITMVIEKSYTQTAVFSF